MRQVLILIWCLATGLSMQAQIADGQRTFRSGYLDSLRSLEQLQYGEEPISESPPPVNHTPQKPKERESPGEGPAWILLLIILGVIGFAAFVVLRQFSGKNRRIQDLSIPTIEEEEVFRTTGFQQLIVQAETNQDWRTAFRFRYLALLQQLEEKGILDWHPHKTDETYLNEISDPGIRGQFYPISQTYAWIWYGRAALSDVQYQQLLPLFHPFSKSPQR